MQQPDPASAQAARAAPQDPRIDARTRRGRMQMLLLLLVCASPVIASYLTYYVFRPAGGQTNYGTLIEPQRPMPAAQVGNERAESVPLDSFKGKWLLVSADGAACDEACARKLFTIRQIRAGQGQDRERIVPVWLVSDDGPIDARLSAAYNEPYAGVRFLRADRAALQKWLPAEPGARIEDTLFLVDPLGNLMMRFPKDPDPKKMSSDLKKLLKYSHIG
ncbi:cytochrome C oxidase subunit I [Cupriavidus basilensis]|uniref:Cytochrome C oxidase subunit I n=1 Tax=Cupriavidus basilensis TaxID=68895 RepID=A0ABT6AHJ3_9BURK|nr:cytochrome C oxidase subunit I [Cupriavidus basilensis]MDF3831868.1 cytochrome C oxidase subunit I [Cupriavidus basilensis]